MTWESVLLPFPGEYSWRFKDVTNIYMYVENINDDFQKNFEMFDSEVRENMD